MRKLTIKLPLIARHRLDVFHPLKHDNNWKWYPYIYISNLQEVCFVNPSTGKEICKVPGVLCSKN